MRNLKKLLLNEDYEDNEIFLFKITSDSNRYIKITQELFKYKEINISINSHLDYITFILDKNTYNIFNRISFIEKAPLLCKICFEESDFKNFNKLIYNVLKFNDNHDNYLNIKFINHLTKNTKILQDVFDYFSKQPINEISIEEIEEYIDDKINSININKTLSKSDIKRKLLSGDIYHKDPNIEKYVLEDSDLAFEYAKNVIRGRFPEGEKIIKTNVVILKEYNKFLKSIGEEPIKLLNIR